MPDRFVYTGTIEAALECPELPRTLLVVTASASGTQTHRMAAELFEHCARRIQPHERVRFYGYNLAGYASYLTHFLPEVFHGETPVLPTPSEPSDA